MKKRVFVIGIAITVFLAGLFVFDQVYMRTISIMGDRVVLASNFDELEQQSDLIIFAEVLPDKENKLDKDQDGFTIFGYTITQLKVVEVLAGNAQPGDVIQITEEYYIKDDGLGKTLTTQENYQPAKENHTYIFYLKKYGDTTWYAGMFFPIDLAYGKYLINHDTVNTENLDNLTNKQLEMEQRNGTRYKEWMKETLKKYQETLEPYINSQP